MSPHRARRLRRLRAVSPSLLEGEMSRVRLRLAVTTPTSGGRFTVADEGSRSRSLPSRSKSEVRNRTAGWTGVFVVSS